MLLVRKVPIDKFKTGKYTNDFFFFSKFLSQLLQPLSQSMWWIMQLGVYLHTLTIASTLKSGCQKVGLEIQTKKSNFRSTEGNEQLGAKRTGAPNS